MERIECVGQGRCLERIESFMIKRSLSNLVWTLRSIRAPSESHSFNLPSSIPATIPGTVHTDLLSAGLIPDPYLGLVENSVQWIGRTTWAYQTVFDFEVAHDARTELVFDGLDTIASVVLNGVLIAETENQHRTYRFDITKGLTSQGNVLEVVFSPSWDYAKTREAELGELPHANQDPYNFVRKMAANFGWDWGPRLTTAGIWKDVRIETWSIARLAETRIETNVLGDEKTVKVFTRLVPSGDAPFTSGLNVRLSIGEKFVTSNAIGEQLELSLSSEDFQLWWPKGMGSQNLHTVQIELLKEDEVIDHWTRRVGIRTVELDTGADSTGSAFTLVVNNLPVFVRGANWIPDDCFPSRVSKDRYRSRIEQATEANINLLRVWGGGIYESEDFYDICDETGVLVWQDFLFACAAYPEDSIFMHEIEQEARDNVLRLSSHPSLVLWCGNNECIWGWFDWGWQPKVDERGWGLGYYLDLLPKIVSELSPSTPYWPGSPYSGSMDISANDSEHANMHIWTVWNSTDYTEYAQYSPRFVSEFGFQGPPTWATLSHSIVDDPLSPESEGMLHHQRAPDGNGKLARGLAPHLPQPHGFQEWHFLMQLNQSRAIEFGIKHFRSLRPHCMGAIVWQLNDCWPVTSWALVDGYGRRKPVWHAVRRAYQDFLLTIREKEGHIELVAVNDGSSPKEIVAQVIRLDVFGNILAKEVVDVRSGPYSNTSYKLLDSVTNPSDPFRELLVLEVGGSIVTTHLFVEEKNLLLQAASLSIELGEWSPSGQEVTIQADTVVRGLTIFLDRLIPEAWSDVSDITLVPGTLHRGIFYSPTPIQKDDLEIPFVVQDLNRITSSRIKDTNLLSETYDEQGVEN